MAGRDAADDDVWGEVLEDGADSPLADLAPECSAVTRRLATVMLRTPPRNAERRGWVMVSGLVALALLTGLAAAWWTRPRSRLEFSESTARRTIERKATAKDQFFLAMQDGSVDAYRSVELYFPEGADPLNGYYVNRARQQLGETYLQQNDWEAAEAIYGVLAKANPQTDAPFAASGLIGAANIQDLRGSRATAESTLARLLPLLGHIPEPVQAQLRQQLNKSLRAVFDQMVRDQQGG